MGSSRYWIVFRSCGVRIVATAKSADYKGESFSQTVLIKGFLGIGGTGWLKITFDRQFPAESRLAVMLD
jgi:hypothetical protein